MENKGGVMKKSLREILEGMFVDITPYISKDIDTAIAEIKQWVKDEVVPEKKKVKEDNYLYSPPITFDLERGYNNAIDAVNKALDGKGGI